MSKPPATLLIPLAAALIALASAALFYGVGAKTPGGVPVFPLDDSYIHMQYGWQAAQGRLLQYNSGDAPTTGATSLLYMLLLAAGFALGIGREAMPAAAAGVGLASFALSAALVADLARRAALSAGEDARAALAGLLAGLLFAGSGWMAWMALSGMETGLYVLLVTAALWALAARRPALTAGFAALAALTRPEALALAAALLAAALLVRGEGWRRRALWGLLPLAAALAPWIVNHAVSGSASASGLLAKAWFTLVPFDAGWVAAQAARALADIALHALGGLPSGGLWHAFPLALIAAAGGALALWRGGPDARRIALACALWIAGGSAATATLQTYSWHHYRYQAAFYPALIALGAAGIVGGIAALARRVRANPILLRRAGMAAALALTICWAVFSTLNFAAAYRLDSHTTLTQQFPLAAWLRENTPPAARIAVHDVGVMRYAGERATVDVVGLTTAGMAAANRNGPGSTYEALRRARPDYYAVYLEGAPPYWGLEQAPAVLGEELFRVHVDPFGVASAHPTQIVTRPDWSQAALADRPQQPDIAAQVAGWELVDRLNVADLADEAAHGYAWWDQGRPAGYATTPEHLAYRADPSIVLTDGGRHLNGGEAFTLRTRPGEALLLVGRFAPRADITLSVEVDGAAAGLWRLPALPGEWQESRFVIPAALVTGAQTRLTLAVAAPAGAQDPALLHSPFYYWAYQGGALPAPAAPQTPVGAAFGEVALLRGYDLPARAFAPGDVLPLTLHWQALQPTQGLYKVFVHVMDPARADAAEGIMAQVDGEPRRGAYPFRVWSPGEAVSETLLVALPPDMPAGDYVLLLGVYDAASGARLPLAGAEDYGAQRLSLGTITLR